jgi:Methyltransferase domain
MMFDLASQLVWLDRIEEYRPEYAAIPEHPTGDPHAYHWRNSFFTTVDGEVLHAMLRTLRPRRLVEVGSGHSSRCAAAALAMNAMDGDPCQHMAIDPKPRTSLPPSVAHLAAPVQEVSPTVFADLEAGDVLFIDAEHRVRTGGAVPYLYGTILPTLARGVVVHIHDIFLPADYPTRWANRRYDEQSVLEATLTRDSAHWEVLLGASDLHQRASDRLSAAFASYTPDDWPSSFWMRRR